MPEGNRSCGALLLEWRTDGRARVDARPRPQRKHLKFG